MFYLQKQQMLIKSKTKFIQKPVGVIQRLFLNKQNIYFFNT